MKRFWLIFFICITFAGLVSADAGIKRTEKLYDADGDRLFENLQERLRTARPDERLPVVILYKEKTPIAGTFAARLNSAQARNMKYSYRNIPAVSVSMNAKEIAEIRNDPWVEHVEYDAPVKAVMNTARSSFGVDAVRVQFGFTGNADGIKGNYSKNDIVVAVIDSGVHGNHPDLRGKILFWRDFLANRPQPYDDNGHGTQVAGVILGAGKQKRKFIGVAPEAALVAFKVLDDTGSGSVSDSIAAIDETISRRGEFNIRVLNLSLAVSGSSSGKDAFSVAANRAVGAGIVVIVAAGNDGPDSRTIGAPSAASKVITVGAGADLGERGFSLARFSSRGPTADGRIKPDLWAPGVRITSPARSGGYSAVSGTSFASPFVAGVAALMLEANPALRPAKIKSILMNTSQKWSPTKSNETGRGRLQAYDALARAGAITEDLDPPDVPTLLFVRSSLNTDEIRGHTFTVNGTRNSIALQVIVDSVPSGGVRIELIDPNGSVIAQTTDFTRHGALSLKPSRTGVYTVRLQSVGGTTRYLLDVSAD